MYLRKAEETWTLKQAYPQPSHYIRNVLAEGGSCVYFKADGER